MPGPVTGATVQFTVEPELPWFEIISVCVELDPAPWTAETTTPPGRAHKMAPALVAKNATGTSAEPADEEKWITSW